MAKPRKRKAKNERLHREPIVREVARLLDTGIPTKWRWTSEARHGLRAAMCLKGMAWTTADARAEEIVTLARHRIGLSQYPSWREAQGEPPQEREYWFCASCGGAMRAHSRPWCSDECRLALHASQYKRARRYDDAARETARRIMFTGGAEQPHKRRERRCKGCDKLFIVPYKEPRQRYCSHLCWARADRRLVERDCLICATPFSPKGPALYCSSACIAEATRRSHRAARARRRLSHARDCRICGETFTTTRKMQVLCGSSACVAEYWLRKNRARRARLREERVAAAAAEPTEPELPELAIAAD